MRRVVVVSLFAVLFTANAFAQTIEAGFSRSAQGPKSYPPAPRLAAAASIAPAAILGAADPSDAAEVLAWNVEGRQPMRNGFARVLPELVAVNLSGAVASKGGAHAGGVVAASTRGLVWSCRFQLEAYRVRLRLDDVKLPAGAVLWIYNESGEPVAFDASLVDPDGGLWTPSVRGGMVRLEVEIPSPKNEADAASFRINRVLELIASKKPEIVKGNDTPSCLIDVRCVNTTTLPDVLNKWTRGVAYLEFAVGNSGFICSGGLLNDASSSGTPWFLTANHCFSTQSAASSVEAYFDWLFASCVDTNVPDPPTNKRVNGATLLASNSVSDFTFVRLNNNPDSNRYYFGSTTTTQPAGTLLHRISHPAPDFYGFPLPQEYSASTVNTTFQQCTNPTPRLRPQFIYSTQTSTQGGVYGGSSGSLAFTASGQIVGQLLGSCGPAPSAGCDTRNATVDGAWATTAPFVISHLTGGGCTANSTTICLGGDRFAVSVAFKNNNVTSNATAIEYTPDSGLFWFFGPDNIEVLFKTLNGCSINSRFWVFSAATTNLEFTLTVRDTKTGNVKTYTNPAGQAAPAIVDVDAFATCP